MKHLILIFIGLLVFVQSFSQTVKIQAGTSFSKLDWQIGTTNIEPYNKILMGYSVFAGLDYLDRRYFNVSSNIGLIRKGGKGMLEYTDETGELTGDTKIEKPTLDYLSINSTVDIKYPLRESSSAFISIGPRFDYLLSSNNYFDDLKLMEELDNISYGLLLGGGVRYDIMRLQVGIRADYYLNFTKIADWPVEPGNVGGKVRDNTVTVNLTIGYKL